MMRLTNLDPQWLIVDGQRIGFTFVSPVQPKRSDGTSNPKPYRQSCFPKPTPGKVQFQLFERAFGDDDYLIQPCRPGFGWMIKGGIENASFETMTVTPSLDGSAGGLWHGHITNGEMT